MSEQDKNKNTDVKQGSDKQHENPSNIPASSNPNDPPTVNPAADNPVNSVDNSGYKPSESKNLKAYNYVGEPKDAEVDFVFTTHLDPNRQQDPQGVYLDDVQRANAEIQRARVEKREPDLKNPPSTCGTQVLPTHVARTLVAGDLDVPVSFSQEIKVGTNEENEAHDLAAARERARQKKERESKGNQDKKD